MTIHSRFDTVRFSQTSGISLRPLILAALLALAACGGGSSGSGSSGSGSGGGGGTPGDGYNEPPGGVTTPDPTLSSIQDNVFTPVCTQCHAGGSAPQGLRLEEGMSYSMLVNVASTEVPSLDRVEPGNPDDSYIIRKLEGTASVGERMPRGGPYLSDETIAAIRQWITDGAMDNKPSAGSNKPVSLASAWPVDESNLTTAPRRLLLVADGELDISLLHAGNIELLRTDPVSGRETAVDVSIRVTSLAPTVMEILVDAQALPDGSYKLQLAGSGNAAIADRNGRLIDGDGDGIAGGDFKTTFTIGAAE